MGKTYDLGSKSDMNKFMKDLESEVMKEAKSTINTSTHQIECPACNRNISVRVGKNTCRFCGQKITVDPCE